MDAGREGPLEARVDFWATLGCQLTSSTPPTPFHESSRRSGSGGAGGSPAATPAGFTARESHATVVGGAAVLSRSNAAEAALVAAHALALLRRGLRPADVAIITPYNGQVKESKTKKNEKKTIINERETNFLLRGKQS